MYLLRKFTTFMKNSFAIDTRLSCTRFSFFEKEEEEKRQEKERKKKKKSRIDLDLRKVVAVQACDVCAVRIREN